MGPSTTSGEHATSSHSVEMVAGNVLGAVMIFLLLQVIVMVIFSLIAVLLPGLGFVSATTGERIGLALAILAELILVTALVRMVRNNLRGMPSEAVEVGVATPTEESTTFEGRLERMMIAGAAIGVVATMLMGAGPLGTRMALMIIESFAVLFLVIAIATRWIMTRRFSALAVGALCLTGWSLWIAMHHR